MPLTELHIKHLKPKAKLYRVADSGGLCLEISTTGSKLWRWRYYFHGKPQMTALGKYPAVSLAQARRQRDEARELVKAGKHPTREKKAKKQRQAYESDNTFKKIALDWHSVRQKGLNEKYRTSNLARLEQLVFPKIGSLPIKEITIPDVANVIEEIGKRKIGGRYTIETAHRVKQMIAQVFRYASRKGLCTHNPAADLREILPSKEKKHHACIHVNEFPDLLRAIASRENDVSKMAMQFLALTFVRTAEVIGAKWEEINWKRSEWHIPPERMKMKRPHVVPLSRQAIALLKELHKETGDTPYLFYSSASKSRHLSNTVFLMALRRMGYKNRMTGHGFRTLASTILNEKKYDPDVIERQLAHEENDEVRDAYNRAEYLPERKKMMQDYADMLDAMREGKKMLSGKFRKTGS